MRYYVVMEKYEPTEIEHGVLSGNLFNDEFKSAIYNKVDYSKKEELEKLLKEQEEKKKNEYQEEIFYLDFDYLISDNIVYYRFEKGEFCVYLLISPSGLWYIGKAEDTATEFDFELDRWKNGKGYNDNQKMVDELHIYPFETWQKIPVKRKISQQAAFALERSMITVFDTKENGLNNSYGQGLEGVHDPKTEEHCRKISEGNMGTKKEHVKILTIDKSGNKKVYSSQIEASEATGVKQPNISRYKNTGVPQKVYRFYTLNPKNKYEAEKIVNTSEEAKRIKAIVSEFKGGE